MKKFILLGILVLSPIVVYAQTGTIGGVVQTIGGLIRAITPIIVALALLFFFWGLAKYILSAGDEEKKSEGRNVMIWGIIALFVMVSVWGIVGIIAETFKVKDGTINVPSVPIKSDSSKVRSIFDIELIEI